MTGRGDSSSEGNLSVICQAKNKLTDLLIIGLCVVFFKLTNNSLFQEDISTEQLFAHRK